MVVPKRTPGYAGGSLWYNQWNSSAFKAELTEVVDELRKSVLKDFSGMTAYCTSHGGQIDGGWVPNYGYVVNTDNYRYCLRCNPVRGDYQAYLTCYDKQAQTMSQEILPCEGIQMGGM